MHIAQLTSLLTGDLLPRDLSFRPLLDELLLLLLFLHDGLLPLLQLLLLLLRLLSLHLKLSGSNNVASRSDGELIAKLYGS